MNLRLNSHPFSVEAFFDLSLVLTFAVPKDLLSCLLPPCFQLETLNERWAFLAIAVVKTQSLRPKGFPEFLGNNFTLVGYRVFVNYTSRKGKRLRGLYILKSETDKRRMEILGNIFTHYKYTTTDIEIKQQDDLINVNSRGSGLHIEALENIAATILPMNSPFTSWKEARRFAGPLPFTFSYDEKKQQVITVEGVRRNWMPKPVKVLSYEVPYLSDLVIDTNAVLASAFVLRDIPYFWTKGTATLWHE